MNKSELLQRITSERQRLFDTMAHLTVEQMDVPILYEKWSAKDLIAHIGWWEIHASSLLKTLQSGAVPDNIIDDTNIDEIDEEIYQEYHDQSLERVHEMEQAAYDHLVKLIEDSPDDDLFNRKRFDWTEGDAFVEWVAHDTYDHYNQHLRDLTRKLDAANE